MVFFGLRTSSDEQITRMQEEIVKLAELREIKRQNRLSLLQRELDFSILAARVGSTLAQSIMSSQYVMGCIAVYFRREWIDYYLNTFAPIIELYQEVPDAAAKAKFQLARRFSFAQRLTAVTLATTIVCAGSAIPSFSGAVITAGRVMGSFGALSFLTLPELGQRITRSFDSFVY